ncbi:MAG: HAD-IA family hydrolase [Thermomicrobiales bacterium]|nr:HAD-IA family hydrolase [Thermomicrobiales bacterium]
MTEPLDPVPGLILLDLDDTLCDYSAARDRRLRIALSGATGLTEDAAELDALVAASIAAHPHGADHFGDLLAQFGYTDSVRAQKAAAWYRANRFHGLELFADAVAVLGGLRFAGHGAPERPLGIITNGPAEVQREKVGLLRIRPLVDFVIISGEFGVAKPDPAIFHEALQRAGVAPEETVFVGDSVEHDIAGAHVSGLRTVWVNRHGTPWVADGRAPDRQIRHIGQLPALIGR